MLKMSLYVMFYDILSKFADGRRVSITYGTQLHTLLHLSSICLSTNIIFLSDTIFSHNQPACTAFCLQQLKSVYFKLN